MTIKRKVLLGIILGLLLWFFMTITVSAASTDYALKFSSDADFTLSAPKNWDGTIEYSIDDGSTWSEWSGAELSGTATQSLYLRGINNSKICTITYVSYRETTFNPWLFTGKYCTGNIENLLDYETVKNGSHPEMADWYCYAGLFNGCTSLEQAPELPATELANACYERMFDGCTSLQQAPELLSTTLAENCYDRMFLGCTALQQAPELPATTLAKYCYAHMFEDCTSLEEAPELLATTLAKDCYYSMFKNCTSLEQAPELPATTLTDYCYARMLEGCTSLEQAPELPATTLAEDCYEYMFYGCTLLEQAPALPATELAAGCYRGMFDSCSSLQRIPELPATELATGCYREMFKFCTSLEKVPDLPATTLEVSCYYLMFGGCTSLKISKEQTDEYKYEYIIAEDGTDADCALLQMFSNTGGTFKGTPEINTKYYVTFPTNTDKETTITGEHITPAEIKWNTPNTTEEDTDKKSECEVIADVHYAYYVSMPASLVLSPSDNANEYTCEYNVKAKTKSDGLAGKYIKIAPDENTDLVNASDNSDKIELSIEQDKIYFGVESNSQVEKVIADAWVTIKGIAKTTTEKQGMFKGNFDFTYGLVDSVE